jgi:hypothetical protein
VRREAVSFEWKAASSKADPRQKQDWFLKCLRGGGAHPLAAWVATIFLLSTKAAGNRNLGVGWGLSYLATQDDGHVDTWLAHPKVLLAIVHEWAPQATAQEAALARDRQALEQIEDLVGALVVVGPQHAAHHVQRHGQLPLLALAAAVDTLGLVH